MCVENDHQQRRHNCHKQAFVKYCHKANHAGKTGYKRKHCDIEMLGSVDSSQTLSCSLIESFMKVWQLYGNLLSTHSDMVTTTDNSISTSQSESIWSARGVAFAAPTNPSSDSVSTSTAATNIRPLKMLSVGLLQTYKDINTKYYTTKTKVKASLVDEDGVFVGRTGCCIGDCRRYIMRERLGRGAFGVVVAAYDTHTKTTVAIKLAKAHPGYARQARTEIELLRHVQAQDPDGGGNVVRLLDTFKWNGHQCIVFEKLETNLYMVLRQTQFRGVPLADTRRYAQQLLQTLELFARPDVDLIHCDLKPENIALVKDGGTCLKVLDLGSSCRNTEQAHTYIQSRYYRAPEVLLGLPYDHSIDVWSLGCILAEMHTGRPLFSGNSATKQVCAIVDKMGLPPTNMLEKMSLEMLAQHFITEENDGQQSYQLKRPTTTVHVDHMPECKLWVAIVCGGNDKDGEADMLQNALLHDLIVSMLAYDPKVRITPAEALQHQFFNY